MRRRGLPTIVQLSFVLCLLPFSGQAKAEAGIATAFQNEQLSSGPHRAVQAAPGRDVSAQEEPDGRKKGFTGQVVDADGEPLIGANVRDKKNKTVTITDIDGNFALPGEDATVVLEISYIGKKAVEAKAVRGKALRVVLEDDDKSLDEVVVTGIFERKASSFTGSAVSYSKDELMKVSNQNVFQSLKNMDPSLMIFDNLDMGSDPNTMPDMQLRGTSSFPITMDASDLKGNYTNNPNLPLFILDGFEATVEKVFDLDMNRIESVTILKDAAAKAIYGSKAANGVVVIETKQMTQGNLLVTYNGSLELTMPDLSSYNLCNAAEKLAVEVASGMYEPDYYGVGADNLNQELNLKSLYNRRLQAVLSGVDTDWMSKPLRNGIGHKHNLSVELGGNDLRLVVDFGYNKVSGVMKGSDRTNISGQVSMSYRHKKFNFRDVLSVTANDSKNSPYGSFSDYSKMNPYWSPVDEYGNLTKSADVVSGIGWGGEQFFANPLYNSQLKTKITSSYVDVTNNLYVEWYMLEGVKATGRFGITRKHNSGDTYYPANHLMFVNMTGDDFLRRGSYQANEGDNTRLSGDFNLNFSRQFGEKHYVFGNAGWSISENRYEEIVYKAEGFPSDRMDDILFARQYAKGGKPNGSEATTRDVGFLSVLNYSYDERYLLDASYRANASSQFGKNSRWGGFWSVGAGWNIHNEPFMKGNKDFDRLKLRGSVGYTGSQGFNAYQSLATYTYVLSQTYDGFLGANLVAMPNKDLKWQRKLDWNVGLDVNWKRKLSIKLDYYLSTTNNTLIAYTLPTSTGFNTVQENVGEIQNVGLEGRINYTFFSQPKERTSFSVNLSAAHNKNKITKISNALKSYNEEQDKASQDQYNSASVVKYYEGMSMNAIWACRSLGIDPANGREIYLDKDGNPTYEYNPANLVVVGDALPKVSGNFGFNAQWRGLELNCVFRYQVGAKMYNQTLVNRIEGCDLNYNVDRRVLQGRWQKPGDVSPYKALPKVWVQEAMEYRVTKTYPTSRFVQKRDELDLSSVNISYDFYRFKFVRNSGLERLKLSFYMNDVFKVSTIRTERGLDYPFSRSFNFALQASF
ncbi:MAG: SusC/RagA family TonB-linked outer membrane protein [Prevotella sp.]